MNSELRRLKAQSNGTAAAAPSPAAAAAEAPPPVKRSVARSPVTPPPPAKRAAEVAEAEDHGDANETEEEDDPPTDGRRLLGWAAANPRTPRTGWSGSESGRDTRTGSSTGRPSKWRRPTRLTARRKGVDLGRAPAPAGSVGAEGPGWKSRMTSKRVAGPAWSAGPGERGRRPRGSGRGDRRQGPGGTGTGNAGTGRGPRRQSGAHLPFPFPQGGGDGRGEGEQTACRERSDPPLYQRPGWPRLNTSGQDAPFLFLPFGDSPSPPTKVGGAGESGRARCPTNPGQEAQAERSDPAAAVPRPQAGPGAIAGDGRPWHGGCWSGPTPSHARPATMAGRAWTDRKRRSDHGLVSSGVEQDAIPRPSRQYWHWFQCSSPGSRRRSSPSWT